MPEAMIEAVRGGAEPDQIIFPPSVTRVRLPLDADHPVNIARTLKLDALPLFRSQETVFPAAAKLVRVAEGQNSGPATVTVAEFEAFTPNPETAPVPEAKAVFVLAPLAAVSIWRESVIVSDAPI